MRTVVIGAAGAIGREVVNALARRGRCGRLVLVDRVPAAAPAGVVGDVRILDVTDRVAAARVMAGADVVVNCTSYHHGVMMLAAAIDAGSNYVDLGGLYNTPRQLALHDEAERAGITAVIGCGATPGLTNVMAMRASQSLERTTEVHISFASHRDIAVSPGLLDTILDEFRPGVARFYWRCGELVEVAPFAGLRRVRFPAPLGEQRVFYVPHSETHTLHRHIPDLEIVAVRGTWRPDDMQTLRRLAEFGLTSDEEMDVGGVRVSPLAVVKQALLATRPAAADKPCAFFLHVDVIGTRAGRRTSIRYVATHPSTWGSDATARMTAIPAAIGAEIVGSGRAIGAGVRPPEAAFEPRAFLAAIAAENVKIHRRLLRPARVAPQAQRAIVRQ